MKGKTPALSHFRTLALLSVLLLLAHPAAAQLAPDATWRTFDTEHFTVTYSEGLESSARRAADRAERAYVELTQTLLEPPEGRVHLVVADNLDLANGYATPFPRNRIVIYAHPPADEISLAFYDDWVELVVTHELTHIFHLDHAEGIWDPLRTVFGRNPVLFPQILLPGWTLEGLATYYESLLTRAGRVRGTYQEMVLRTAILEDAFFSIDRATGTPATWPSGATRYIYGSMFVEHLANVHGPESVVRFIDEYGGRLIPFRVNSAAKDGFGTGLTDAWNSWADSLRAEYAALADSLGSRGITDPEILTGAGRLAVFPRYSPGGDTIVYAADTGRELRTTRLILPGGGVTALEPRTTLGPTAWTADGSALIYSELDFVDPYRIYSDVQRLRLGDGDDEQLTEGARIWEIDLHPAGGSVVGIGNAEGTNVVQVTDLATGEPRTLTEPSLDVNWSLPRWSPDGTRIAVGRWRAGGFYDVVILDAAGDIVREITSDRAVDREATWSPDGRYVVFSSDRTGIANLYAYDLSNGTLHQVTNVLTGAFQPDISPDGREIVFAYYSADGFHIARMPFDPAAWTEAPPVREAVRVGEAEVADLTATAGGEDREYSAWPSIAPTYWSIVAAGGTELGVGLGLGVSGRDLVERHRWIADASVFIDGWRVDAGAGYQYRGLGQPVVKVAATQRWRVDAGEGVLTTSEGDTIPSALLRRSRLLDVSLSWQRPRWRSTSWLRVGTDLRKRDLAWEDEEAVEPLDLRFREIPLDAGASLEAGYSSAQSFPFSLGPQRGILVAGSVQGHRYLEPFEGDDEVRGYVRNLAHGRGFAGFDLIGFAHHVLALRVDAGVDAGSRSPGFRIGGSGGGALAAAPGLDLFGSSVAFPLRGYPEGIQRGVRAVSASAEYRFPLALVERGIGVIPLYLDRIWGDLFADAATAWDPADAEVLTSLGGELIADLTLGYHASLSLRTGVAVPLADYGPKFYVRLGRSF